MLLDKTVYYTESGLGHQEYALLVSLDDSEDYLCVHLKSQDTDMYVVGEKISDSEISYIRIVPTTDKIEETDLYKNNHSFRLLVDSSKPKNEVVSSLKEGVLNLIKSTELDIECVSNDINTTRNNGSENDIRKIERMRTVLNEHNKFLTQLKSLL